MDKLVGFVPILCKNAHFYAVQHTYNRLYCQICIAKDSVLTSILACFRLKTKKVGKIFGKGIKTRYLCTRKQGNNNKI